jgi:hypothetical protein
LTSDDIKTELHFGACRPLRADAGQLFPNPVEIRDKVAALKKQGKSLPDVVAAKPGARYDAVWGNLFQNPSDFVALVYQGV